ncbi:DUF1489 domain-containing protein [Kiloniella laminariae]|uniref:DUF1489 domain-containing protein n=1 Tax=Kiloniella laminariae TaxID=454162 RepID=A0ABT4LPA2_9PROT|nr:DUF1489 domain-containing protein [Kiloniella laminariae]MCZ4282970.1 DUF1489 domain-containing protein [Kiloniella laminariae]
MPLNLIKLSVGTETPETLEVFQAQRKRDHGVIFHQTRMFPKRRDEIIAGGSIYWVIKGQIRARQLVTDIIRVEDQDGRSMTRFILDSKLVLVHNRRHRAFQGWRYFREEDVPPDLGENDSLDHDLPEDMALELEKLGLL